MEPATRRYVETVEANRSRVTARLDTRAPAVEERR
jgi:hypothetical protein